MASPKLARIPVRWHSVTVAQTCYLLQYITHFSFQIYKHSSFTSMVADSGIMVAWALINEFDEIFFSCNVAFAIQGFSGKWWGGISVAHKESLLDRRTVWRTCKKNWSDETRTATGMGAIKVPRSQGFGPGRIWPCSQHVFVLHFLHSCFASCLYYICNSSS